jgi:hypothetical protein
VTPAEVQRELLEQSIRGTLAPHVSWTRLDELVGLITTDPHLTALLETAAAGPPAAETRTEWAVEDPQRTAFGRGLHLFGTDEEEARYFRQYRAPNDLRLRRRTVHVGPWEPA